MPTELPICRLIKTLMGQAKSKHDTDFDHIGALNEFRKRVSQETRHINLLFPEYTPHDEQYHLTNLFHIADVLLNDQINKLNVTELFLLACALYGHDWGMAVSETEKAFILSHGKSTHGNCDVPLTRNQTEEFSRFSDFCTRQQLTPDETTGIFDIDDEDWKEYVRQTHAFRSGERCHEYFKNIDPSISDALKLICIGHWVDLEELLRQESYPKDFGVQRESVNLAALTVYLRLVDLFDLGRDRTPYVIWKFVSPRNSLSKLEWAKHRALGPITCPPIQNGRKVRVDGSTDDYEVFAALKDLYEYCNAQLTGCLRILEHINDPRHTLDIHYVDWQVKPIGFLPTSIRFEFDRSQLFEILSTEIYGANSYVFIRELLQNSIDAIRTRVENLKRKGLGAGSIGSIRVSVEHQNNGLSVVKWTDDGIGMEESIVRNYLAVAGRSFYRSKEFEQLGLNFDPISRFGIGVLSCFMVATRIEIETQLDPNIRAGTPGLSIVIPDVQSHFRVSLLPTSKVQVGTTVTVYIEHKKFRAGRDECKHQINVTEYLSQIAGFVGYPIYITENNVRTIILHPDMDPKTLPNTSTESDVIHKIDMAFKWEDFFAPQSIDAAKSLLVERSYDLTKDFGLNGFEGSLTHLVPLDESTDATGPEYNCSKLLRRGEPFESAKELRRHGYRGESSGILQGASHENRSLVFRDGILVPGARISVIQRGYTGGEPLPGYRLVTNVFDRRRIDIARTRFLTYNSSSDDEIRQAFLTHIVKDKLKQFFDLSPFERTYALSRLMLFYHVQIDELWNLIPGEQWPVPILSTNASLQIVNLGSNLPETIYHLPLPFWKEAAQYRHYKWYLKREYRGSLNDWTGEVSLDESHRAFGMDYSSHGISMSLQEMPVLWRKPIRELYTMAEVRFLKQDGERKTPIIQRVSRLRRPTDQGESLLDVLQKFIAGPTTLSPSEVTLLNRELLESLGSRNKLETSIYRFHSPFHDYFGYGFRIWNLNHSFTQLILRCCATMAIRRKNMVWDQKTVAFNHALDSMITTERSWEQRRVEEFLHWADHLVIVARDCQIANDCDLEGVEISPDDFVPGTIHRKKDGEYVFVDEWNVLSRSAKSFGEPHT